MSTPPRHPGQDDPELASLNAELESALADAALDIAGVFDPTPVSDSIAAARALARGDYVDAGLSLISIVPYVGDAVGKTAKGARMLARITRIRAKIAKRLADLGKTVVDASRARTIIKEARPFGDKITKALERCPKRIGRMTGMLPEAVDAVMQACAKHKVQVVFRDTNKEARRWLRLGHPPKPETLKMKTVDAIDELIGGPKGVRGQVGFFKPKGSKHDFAACLADLKERDPKAWRKVMKDPKLQEKMQRRFDARWKEIDDYKLDVKKRIRNGEIREVNGVIVDAKTGKAYAGDHDMYEVLDLNGAPLPKEDPRVIAVQHDLRKPPVNAQHDSHVYWDTKGDPEYEGIKQGIITKHQTEGGLTIIGPQGAVRAKAPPPGGTSYQPHNHSPDH